MKRIREIKTFMRNKKFWNNSIEVTDSLSPKYFFEKLIELSECFHSISLTLSEDIYKLIQNEGLHTLISLLGEKNACVVLKLKFENISAKKIFYCNSVLILDKRRKEEAERLVDDVFSLSK